MSSTEQPLAGLRVIDLTTFLSGPSATQLLGDLGADVIKVESQAGDSSRAIAGPSIEGESAYFLANNRNKRSIVVDLKSEAGLEILTRLVDSADVVIENFRPGVMRRLGLEPKAALARKPELVWASISGFGQEGPLSGRPAYDMVVQALSGVMSLTGHPGAPAARLGIPAGDVVAGLYAVIGILAALRAREVSGVGRIVDVSMLKGQLAMLSYQALYTLITGVAPAPQGAGHDSIATYRSFRGGDGREFVVTANTPRMWESLCAVLGHEELVADPRFVDGAARLEHRVALWEILEAAFATAPAAHWVAALTDASVPVAPVKNVLEALDDAKAADDGSLIPIADGESAFENVATPITFVDVETRQASYPPRLGAHTVEVLTQDLGYTADQVSALIESGCVLTQPGAPQRPAPQVAAG
ncbi:CaiB/BaiF CoA transferase family protein [Leucobacter luti]|uniref:Crotonobetainyl-CoA:carnitine CoA-transferase CaiB-like acyl-CoA transferase n=1 Tax=Leucobacter luti TaxID=340320 RepID=A0A4Q7U0X4_9MICO|nr:CoA transferase [Leucobacter luti]MBL3699534.1 CoA transferase [Leucobacter luti]RZT67046.1 crotonobetainyl-CoA:carnitine CoA-transferase CaiB-like acyl-CoA transferase [Leucobacter luti]